MIAILNLIKRVKKGESDAFIELYERFRPLIIAWLKQSRELYQENRQDYESKAKIILYECAKSYDEGRGVPFQSYYKIKLYHWYANHKRKKHVQTISIKSAEQVPCENQEAEDYKEQIKGAIGHLTEIQRDIILKIMEGFTEKQIAELFGLSKKTIQNKKYEAIAKLKEIVNKK